MTLDDAIKHCQQVANESNCECAKEHKQLAQWLQELKKFKKMQTNEEWFCGLSTKEKARFLACEFTVACDDYAYFNNKETWNEKYWLEWLKQPHKEKHE